MSHWEDENMEVFVEGTASFISELISVGSSFRKAELAKTFKQLGSSNTAVLVLNFVRVSNTTVKKTCTVTVLKKTNGNKIIYIRSLFKYISLNKNTTQLNCDYINIFKITHWKTLFIFSDQLTTPAPMSHITP